MKIEITATLEKGGKATAAEVRKTMNEVLKIVRLLGGSMVYGKGLTNGTKVVVEK